MSHRGLLVANTEVHGRCGVSSAAVDDRKCVASSICNCCCLCCELALDSDTISVLYSHNRSNNLVRICEHGKGKERHVWAGIRQVKHLHGLGQTVVHGAAEGAKPPQAAEVDTVTKTPTCAEHVCLRQNIQLKASSM